MRHELIEQLDELPLTMSMDLSCSLVADMALLPSLDLVSEVKETDLLLVLDLLD